MATKKRNLSPRKIEILNLINHFISNLRYSPTIREIAEHLSLSRTTVFEHIADLQENGYLSTSQGKARSLKLTTRSEKLLNDESNQPEPEVTQNGIPLLGKVAAGMPVDTTQSYGMLSLNSEFGRKSNIFALEVTGLSMLDDNICPGDHVICEKSDTAKNGDLIIALVDGTETTLKRYYKEKDHIRLQPSNDKYKPILTIDCQIQAKIIGLIRKLN